MEPEALAWPSSVSGTTPVFRRATLVDLLDRVLDRGLFLRADLVISLAGIPLIGASLSVAVAGTETLLKYGMLADGPLVPSPFSQKAGRTPG